MRHKNEKGSTLAWVVIAMVVLIALSGMVIDVGRIHWEQSHMQRAAEAAALAAVYELDDANNMFLVACDMTERNGFTHEDNAIIEVSSPTSTTCKVDISRTIPIYLARIMGYREADIVKTATAERLHAIHTLTAGAWPWTIINPSLNNDPFDDLTEDNYGKRYILGYGEDNVMVPDWADGYGAIPHPPDGNGRGWRGAIGLKADGTMGSDAGAEDIRYTMSNGWSGSLSMTSAVPTKTGNMTSAVSGGRSDRLGDNPLSWNEFDIREDRQDGRVVFIPIVHMLTANESRTYTANDWNNGLAWDHSQVIIDGFAPFFLLTEAEQGDVNGDGNVRDRDWLTGYFIPGVEVSDYLGMPGEDYGLYTTARLVK